MAAHFGLVHPFVLPVWLSLHDGDPEALAHSWTCPYSQCGFLHVKVTRFLVVLF